jgi:hypothetical protein
MKLFIQCVAAMLAIVFCVYLAVAFAVWHDVARADDRDITNKIRQQIVQALDTNFSQHIDVVVAPSHQKTVIFVRSVLSEEEKKKLLTIANETSRRNLDRRIEIVYK